MCHGVGSALDRALCVHKGRHGVNAQILPHSAKQADACLILQRRVVALLQSLHNVADRSLSLWPALVELSDYFLGIKAELFEVLVCCAVAHSYVKLFYRVAQLVNAPCSSLGSVCQHVEHVVGRISGVPKLDAVLVDRVQKVVVLVQSFLCPLHDKVKRFLCAYAKLIREAVRSPQAFHYVEAEHVLQRDRVFGYLSQRSLVQIVGHLNDGGEFFRNVSEAVAIVGVVNLVHDVLEAFEFLRGGSCSGA